MPLLEYNNKSYWIPDILPDATEECNQLQSTKIYLKPDKSIINHPGWYFSNQAYASDEYFYRNEGWLTIYDDRPKEIDDDGNNYIIIESPMSEWEEYDEYKIQKKYKKYLLINKEKPTYKFDVVINHSYDFDDDNMTATDLYTTFQLSENECNELFESLISKIRNIRNYILNKTDFYIIISQEKNIDLSNDFINYRQNLRDIPNNLTMNDILEDDVIEINKIDTQNNNNIEIGEINITFFPPKPNNIFN